MAKPAYRAYTVIKREDKDDYWLNLGACYPHEDGEGERPRALRLSALDLREAAAGRHTRRHRGPAALE